ncbi:hypothetical protein BH10ACT8_BH10ACT8_03030 [soil metagenome]
MRQSTTRPGTPPAVRWGLSLLAVVLLGALAACSPGSHSTSASSGLMTGPVKAADGAAVPGAPAAGPAGAGESAGSTNAGGSAAKPAAITTPLQQKDLVRTATLDVQVPDIDRAASAVLDRAARAAAEVAADDRTSTDSQRTATLVFRVPPDKLDAVITDVVAIGKELDRTIQGDDVTAAHADVKARVAALTISVARLRDFLSHSGTINDLVSLENQLSQRESELASTVAQQRALESQIALSTLTVHLTAKPTVTLAAGHHGPSGFGTALGGGVHGLLVALRWVAAVLGYALPFVLVTAAGAVPLLVWRRRRSHGAVAPLDAEPSPVS